MTAGRGSPPVWLQDEVAVRIFCFTLNPPKLASQRLIQPSELGNLKSQSTSQPLKRSARRGASEPP